MPRSETPPPRPKVEPRGRPALSVDVYPGPLPLDPNKVVRRQTRPIGEYPDHWVDEWHSLQGGDDKFGARPQHGLTLLQSDLSSLS